MGLFKRKSENFVASLNIVSTIIVAGISFFTIPIFTRLLDTDGYGVVTIYEAWVQIFVIFIGLKADGSIGSAQANLDEKEQESYQYSVLLLSLISFSVVSTAFIIYIEPASVVLGMSEGLVICLLVQSFGAFLVQFFNMRFIFRKEAQKNFFVSVGLCVATTVLSIALIAVIPINGELYYGRAVGLAVPNVLLGLALFINLAKMKGKVFQAKYWKFCVLLTLPLIFHGLSQQVLSQTGKIAIQHYVGDSGAGIFGLAVTISSLITYIYTALNNAFVPFMYEDLAGKTTESIKQRHFNNYFLLFSLGTCAFALMAPELLKVMSTEAYWPALEILPILVIGKYCVFLYSFPVNYEFYKMKTGSIAVGTIFAAVVNVVLCASLVPSFGLFGAAVASTIAYIALFVFHLGISRLILGDHNYSAWKFFAGFAAVCIVSLSYYFLSEAVLFRWLLGTCFLSAALLRIVKTKTIF